MADKISRKKSVVKTAAGTRAAKTGPRTTVKKTSPKNTDRKSPKPIVREQKVGVMNPYILARVIMGNAPGPGSIHPQVMHPHISNDDMVEAFKKFTKGKVQTFNDIFDPKKSPLFKPQNLHQYVQRGTKQKISARKMPAVRIVPKLAMGDDDFATW